MQDGSPITTNSIEAWHHALNGQIGADHVDIWALIGALKQDEILGRQKTISEESGSQLPSLTRETADKYNRMRTLLERYSVGTIGLLQLIQGLSRSVTFVQI